MARINYDSYTEAATEDELALLTATGAFRPFEANDLEALIDLPVARRGVADDDDEDDFDEEDLEDDDFEDDDFDDEDLDDEDLDDEDFDDDDLDDEDFEDRLPSQLRIFVSLN